MGKETPAADYYEILQVNPRADQEVIERAYRLLAKRYHPDNEQTGDATKFQILIEAYRALSDPEKRAAMAIAYSEPLVKRMRSLGYSVAEFDRTRTPPDLLEEEGSTLAWGVQDVMEELGRVPDAIFDRGAIGKVPLIRLFANSPGAIVDLIAKL